MNLLNGRTALAAVMTLIFAVMLAMALSYPPNARLMPLVIGVPGLVLCGVQLAIEIRETRRGAPAQDVISWAEVRFFLWFPAFIAAVLALGFLAATPLMVFVFLRYSQHEPLKLAAGFAVGGAVGIYVVFEGILGLELFRGFLFPLLVG